MSDVWTLIARSSLTKTILEFHHAVKGRAMELRMKRLLKRAERKWRRAYLSVLVIGARFLFSRRGVVPHFTYQTQLRTEGGGAQIHNRIATFALSKGVGGTFDNFQMTHVDHGAGGDWITNWNNLLDFSRLGFPSLALESYRRVSVVTSLLSALSPRERNFSFSITNPHFLTDVMPELIDRIRTDLVSIYSPRYMVQASLDVAIHLRRLQPADIQFTSQRLSSFDQISNRLQLESRTGETIVVFTSPKADSTDLQQISFIKVDTGDAIQSFVKMVGAKELVIGHSSLSYVAGLLNENKVWYSEFWHPPMPKWLQI